MKVSTSEAIRMANESMSLKDVVLEDINDVQISVKDALSLSRQGIVVPEANVFYDDDDIVYDEEIDELERIGELRKMSWEEKEAYFTSEDEETNEVTIKITTSNSSMSVWLAKNSRRISELLEPILLSLYTAEITIKKFTHHDDINDQ